MNTAILLVPTLVLTALVFADRAPTEELMWALQALVGGSASASIGKWTKSVLKRRSKGEG